MWPRSLTWPPVLGSLNARHGCMPFAATMSCGRMLAVWNMGQEVRILLLNNAGAGGGGQDLFFWRLRWLERPTGPDDGAEALPGQAPVIPFAHEPGPADRYAADGRIAHNFPATRTAARFASHALARSILPYLARKYDMGLYRIGEMWLYTNRGLGVTNEPVRYNCPPRSLEITLVRA